jgi:hypothetical protein
MEAVCREFSVHHGITIQKDALFKVTAVRISNPTIVTHARFKVLTAVTINRQVI